MPTAVSLLLPIAVSSMSVTVKVVAVVVAFRSTLFMEVAVSTDNAADDTDVDNEAVSSRILTSSDCITEPLEAVGIGDSITCVLDIDGCVLEIATV